MPAIAILEPIAAELRVYLQPPATRCAQHAQAAAVRWRPDEPGTAWLTMHTSHVPHTRATLRAMRDELRRAGLAAVYGERTEGHCIPGALDLGNGVWRYDLARGLAVPAGEST